MTTTSAENSGFIDTAAYGLDEEQLLSLRALDVLWWDALTHVPAQAMADAALAEFFAVASDLPSFLGDLAWQQRWMLSWHKLHGRGISIAELLLYFFRAVEYCETQLFDDASQVGRLHLELFSVLRRAVVAAVSCAIEMGEEAESADAGVPGELAALRALRQMSLSGEQVAVISLTLVNRNAFVHLAASDLISLSAMLAERLQSMLRPEDKVFAGRESEWLILLPGIHSMTQPSLAAAHIRRTFENPVTLVSGRSILFEARMGAAMFPTHASEADETVHAARLARWDVAAGHDSFAWFHPGLNQDWGKHYEMLEELRHALHQETLELYLQPQVVIDGEECVGAELLLRWQRRNGEWVPPPQIMEMVNENGWRAMFTDWLLRYAMRTSTDLQAAGVEISLSLNLMAEDLQDSDLPDLVSRHLETWQIPASRFTLELTESSMMGDRDRCLDVMQQLKARGLRLALDDFGTGYSSLSYLATLPIDEIKIDRSFVVGMLNSPEGLRIVRTIIDLTRDLEKTPLAEGVEDEEQLDQLRAMGCVSVQGYYYAKPMPMEEFITWYQARKA
jgi:EAL domain-containing protein (putative c-di-GMP-specific phosphodiesterase class I)/GGDEF domain-containing protein